MMDRIAKGPADVKKSVRVADEMPGTWMTYSVFHWRSSASIWGHALDARWEDYEMRKGLTRKPQGDEPATQGKNYITRSGLQRLKDEHRFLLTDTRASLSYNI